MAPTTRAIDVLKRFWWIMLAFAIGGAVIGYLPEPEQPTESVTRWTATHTMLISSSSNSGSLYSDALTFNQIQLFATVGEVPQRVADALDYDGAPAALAGQITVAVDQSTGAMRLSTVQETSDEAVRVADAFAAELATYLVDRQDQVYEERITSSLARLQELETQVESIEEQLRADPDDAVLAAQLDAVSRQYSVAFEQNNTLQATEQNRLLFTTLESAQPVATTERGLSAPGSRRGRSVMGGIAGLAIGAGLAFLLARTDRKMRSRDQVEQVLGISAHVTIPDVDRHDVDELAVARDRHDPLSDAYRTLRSIISFADAERRRPDGRCPITLVVSPSPGDGKTSGSANLAAAFAESGVDTTVVNTDFRRPTLAKRLGVGFPAPVGMELGDLPHAPLELILTPTSVPDLSVFDLSLMRGHNPTDLARATARMLPRVTEESEMVVVDTSPVGATAEVLEFVPLADYIVLVVRLGNTSIQAAKRTLEMVSSLSTAHIFLAVVGGGSSGESSYYYYYSSSDEEEPKESGRRGRRKQPAQQPSVSS